ncbi:MAG: tyrosine-type recombinase/integrase [Gammaproteobacteria bacterium]|nr:tyrosine-type recombinase/integrase [Gammaproteobacteria bacterium]MBU1978630.1 tyrosine-type recombinase/integrase [Gammaproteobacteria bacterium]
MSQVMKRYLTDPEQKKLLSTIRQFADVPARRDSAWVSLLISTGMRVGEFSRMTVGDARAALRTGYIFIPREHRKGQRADHEVLVTVPVRAALEQLLEIHCNVDGGGEDDSPLVLSRKGCALTIRAYQQRVELWSKMAGLPEGVSPHWFRHTRAMNIMRKTTSNDPRGIAQAALGHVSIGSTAIYTATSREDLEKALNEVDGAGRVRLPQLRKEYEGRVGV